MSPGLTVLVGDFNSRQNGNRKQGKQHDEQDK
jgi:hypothetical protein